MAEDERLREALLELQLLRDRESRTLHETKRLLECIENYSRATNPGDALTSIFLSLRNHLGAARACVVARRADGDLDVVASDTPDVLGTTISAPIDVFLRSRNVSDLNLLGQWSGSLSFDPYSGLLVAPGNSDLALLAFRDRKDQAFVREDLDLLARLAGLAVQAVQNSDISAENDLLAATISGSSSGFAIADASLPDRPLVYVNEAFERITGYAGSEVIGQNCRFLAADDGDAPERMRLRQAVRDKTAGTFLLRNRRKSGEMFWNELTLFPVSDPDNTVRHLVATQVDVSARIEAAEERDRMRSRMERALAATEDAFLILESDGRVLLANSAVNELFPSRELAWGVGTFFEENWKAYLEECVDLPGRVTQLLRAPDLARLTQMSGGQEIDLPDGRSLLLQSGALEDGGLVVSGTDVTAMKSAQHLLSQRLSAIEAAQDGIAVTDNEGRLIYLNSAASQLLGFGTAGNGLGRKWTRKYQTTSLPSMSESFEVTLQRTDSANRVMHEITASPLESDGAVIVIRDISENLATEAREKELMKDLIRMQRQEAIAQLTAGVAHDFNNLLSAINGSATLIGMSDDIADDVRPHVERILAAGTQSAKLVNRLLDIGTSTDAVGTFDLTSTLTDLPALVRPSLPDAIQFHIRPGRSALALKGNAGVLSQILINLALNARDAIGSAEGAIEVNVTSVRGRESGSLSVGRLEPEGLYALITVQDDGSGMDMETAASIFQPYFSTKGRHGSGLGLATVAMQVQSIGGGVGISSEVGVGTGFSIYWPMAQSEALTTGERLPDSADLRGATLIVVDDDPGVSAVISAFLEARGAEVAVCEDPRDAVSAIEEDPDGWTALITDYDMPVMNGGELAAKVRDLAPKLPIIVVTALARRLTDPRLLNGQAAAILSKPVDLEHLCTTVAEART